MAVTSFGIERELLEGMLREAQEGKSQLPDFQRGWVWDDAHVRSLLASISLAYPIGAVMMLRAGGENVRFKQRPIEGASPPPHVRTERLILDGQQRLTSLFQSLMLGRPVTTRDERGKEILRWYYVDMRKALDPETDREEAIVSLPADRIIRTFRNEIVADYSTPEKEYEAMLFPLGKVFDPDDWRVAFEEYWNYAPESIKLWNQFNKEVIRRFALYHIPVIELSNDTPKDAVCAVFEKVNTGGVTLTVFELLTATFAADGYELRKDWDERQRKLRQHRILSGFSNTDFLQAITLLATWDRRKRALAQGSDGDRAPAIGCRRVDMLKLALNDYTAWADQVMHGLFRAEKFLYRQHLFDTKFLPYGSQLIPLCAILSVLDKDWDAQGNNDKLARWFWCGVFGELYGGTTETRFSRDLPEVIDWMRGGPEPRTVTDAVFTRDRLLSLRTRGSAAYKGIYALLLREGARDFRTGQTSDFATYFDEQVDIHHIFPQHWCRANNIAPALCDSIVNKTPLTSRTNRVIGGRAPSEYVSRVQNSAGISEEQLDAHLRTHLIDPILLRTDDFSAFFERRQTHLLQRIGAVMGKTIETIDVVEAEELVADFEVGDDTFLDEGFSEVALA
ncbi:MAG: hypothetical protein DCC58_16185 [Chloroflexi bacterium]|nr:MAG: hypothetical protein DCC58_16185 [Chloroflexota bacterium]